MGEWVGDVDRGRSRQRRGTLRRARRAVAVMAALLLVAVCASCARTDDSWGDAPGANGRVGQVLVRYAHLEDPADSDVYPPGSDVPLYVWLSNEADEPVRLTGAMSDVADAVGLSVGEFPIVLPPGRLVELGRSGQHLELRGTTQQIAGQDLVPITLEVEPGGSLTLQVEPVEVLPGEAAGE